MQQPPNSQSTQSEGRMALAMSAIDQNQFRSVQRAAETYDLVQTTLRRRHAGIPSRRDCTLNSKKLTDLEESVIIQHILDLDMQGFSLKLSAIRDIANKLLAVHDKGNVGIL
jgi:hypothetical protein